MAVGDVYTYLGTPRLPLWVIPADVVGANMPVLTDYSGRPEWVAAAAAVAAGANVLTISSDFKPTWAALSSGSGGGTPVTEWLIALVAGGTTQASTFIGGLSPAVDGALGTNTMYGPSVMSFAPDGTLWFMDGTGGQIRTYDPATGLVASAFSVNAGSGTSDGELGIAVDGGGNVWVYFKVDDDIPFAAIQAWTADGGTFLGGASDGSRGGPLPGIASALAFSPDFTRIYYGEGRDGSAGIRYLLTADVLSGEFVTTDYGLADVPASTIGVSTDADGNVYSVGYEQGGGAKVTATGTVTNLTNIVSGQDFAGDGLPAFTSGDTTPQLAHPTAIAYDPVTDTIAIVDHDNFVIRSIASDGILRTIAGVPLFSGGGLGNFPDATPADARTKYLGGSVNSVTPAPGGGFYVSTGSDFDAEGVDGIWALYKLYPGSTSCLSATPTIRLVAGGTVVDGPDADGTVGTSVVTNVRQMCWGPDGKIYFMSGNQFIRTYDPATGEIATTALDASGLTNIGIQFANDGTLFAMSLDHGDEATPQLFTFAPGAVDNSGLIGSPRTFNEYGGAAALVTGIGVVSGFDGQYIVFFSDVESGQIDFYDTATNSLRQGWAGNSVPPISANPDSENVGEGVDAFDGSLGFNSTSLAIRDSELIVGSYESQMVRSITLNMGEETDPDRLTPVTGIIHSVTNHSLDRGTGYGGDGVAAFTLGDYGPQFNGVSAVERDECGNYFILDNKNHRLRMVDTDGILHTIAGDGTDGSTTGFPTATPVLGTSVGIGLFDSTSCGSLLVDPAGGIYVAVGGALSAILKVEG